MKKKDGRKSWLWRVRPKQRWGLGSGRGQCSGPTVCKRPWGLWGVGLRLKEQEGPRHALHPWSQRAGDLTWEPSRLPGLEWVGQTPSSSLLLLRSGRTPLTCLSWSPRPPSYAPKDPHGLEGALEDRELAWELSRLPVPEWAGQSPSTPLLLLLEGPSRLPLLISLASLLCPQGPKRPGGGFGGQGTGLGAQQAPLCPSG